MNTWQFTIKSKHDINNVCPLENNTHTKKSDIKNVKRISVFPSQSTEKRGYSYIQHMFGLKSIIFILYVSRVFFVCTHIWKNHSNSDIYCRSIEEKLYFFYSVSATFFFATT